MHCPRLLGRGSDNSSVQEVVLGNHNAFLMQVLSIYPVPGFHPALQKGGISVSCARIN